MDVSSRLSNIGSLPAQIDTTQSTQPSTSKAQQALTSLRDSVVSVAANLPFSARLSLGRSQANASGPINLTTATGRAHKTTSGAGVLAAKSPEMMKTSFKESASVKPTDVAGLGAVKGGEVRAEVEKYSGVQKGGSAMLRGDLPGGDWVGLQSSKFSVNTNSATKEIFTSIKNAFDTVGFKPAREPDKGFYHEATGTRIAVMHSRDTPAEISVFIQGLEVPKAKGFGLRLKEIVADSLGLKCASRELAIKLGETLKTLKKNNPDTIISVVGHSHGGNLAQTVALTAGIKGVCFNSRRISGQTQKAIGNENLIANHDKIKHFNKQGDFLTKETGILNRIITGWGHINGSGKAQRFGTEYSLPPSTGVKGAIAIHNDTGWPSSVKYSTETNEKTNNSSEISHGNMSPEQFSDALHTTPPPTQELSRKAKEMLNLE